MQLFLQLYCTKLTVSCRWWFHAVHAICLAWPNSSCKDCGLKFTVVRRRHHCRACGHVFCHECSRFKMKLPSFGYMTEERVCDHCYSKYKIEKPAEWLLE